MASSWNENQWQGSLVEKFDRQLFYPISRKVGVSTLYHAKDRIFGIQQLFYHLYRIDPIVAVVDWELGASMKQTVSSSRSRKEEMVKTTKMAKMGRFKNFSITIVLCSIIFPKFHW